MPPHREIAGVDDSKRLSPARRELLAAEIEREALGWAVGSRGPGIIDRINILAATYQAMLQAIGKLRIRPELILVDGWPIPTPPLPCRGIIGGDRRSYSIACASILAKVHRDRLMRRLDRTHPGYGLADHKGYPTSRHVRELKRRGPSAIHRRSFGPVRDCIRS